jgi:Protein of unknown function (DUF3224)
MIPVQRAICQLPLLGLAVALLTGAGLAQSSSAASAAPSKAVTIMHARGTFDVKLTPQPSDDKSETPLGRMTLDKVFHGDLDGTSHGEMLTGGSTVKGSGAYVAVERFEGTLQGRHGTFVLYHTGVMTRGTPELSIRVVPDSGTGQITGISGKLNIQIDQGKHSYDFEYTLPDAK